MSSEISRWRGFLGRAAFRARDEKPAVILNSLDDSEGVHPWWMVDRKGQRDGAAIYRRFPAPHAVVLRNYFPCPVPLGVDQSVHGAKFLNGAGRVMGLKFGRDYPCKLKKISICTRKSHGNELFHRAAIRFELIRFFSKVCLRLSPPRIPMIDKNREN